MRVFSDNEVLQENWVIITTATALILLIAGIVYIDPGIIKSLESLVTTVISTELPDMWLYLIPVMPALNICFYLLGAIAILLIGREYIFADRYIYFAVAAYLLYFPLAGMNWSTFTTISIFPSFFLLGFYFYKIELRWLSGIFFILAATTMLIYTLLVIVTGFAILAKDRNREIQVRENRFAVAVVLISLLTFFVEATHSQVVGYYGQVSLSSYGFILNIVNTITYAKPLFFIVLLVPLITFGFFGPRLLPVSIPYFILGIITTAAGTSPEPLVAILDLILPLAFIGSLRWIGKKVETGIMPTETRIIRFALFSLILMNILVVVTYFPFLSIIGNLLGL